MNADHVRIGNGEILCEHCEKREPVATTFTKASEIFETLERWNAEHQHCEPNLRKIIGHVKAAAAAADRSPMSDGLGELLIKRDELDAVITMAEQFVEIDEQGQWLCGLMWDAEVSRMDAIRFRGCASCGLKKIPAAELTEHIENCPGHPSQAWKARALAAEEQLAAVSLSLHQATEPGGRVRELEDRIFGIRRYVRELMPMLESRSEFKAAFEALPLPPPACSKCKTKIRKFTDRFWQPCRDCDGSLCEKCCDAAKKESRP